MIHQKKKYDKLKLVEFADKLSKLPGEKDMIIHESVIARLNSFCKLSSLNQMDIRKLYKLQESPLDSSFTKLVYILPANRSALNTFLKHLKIEKNLGIKRNILLIVTPICFYSLRCSLKETGLLHSAICIEEFSFGWVPYSDDLLSLEIPECFPQSFIHHNYSLANVFGVEIAKLLSLKDTRQVKIHSFGNVARATYESFKVHSDKLAQDVSDSLSHSSSSPKTSRMVREPSLSSLLSNQSDSNPVNSLRSPFIIFFGRNIDYATCFTVPMSFEALIHENMKCALGQIEQPGLLSKKVSSYELSQGNFRVLRNLNISAIYENLKTLQNELEHEKGILISKFDSWKSNDPSMGHGIEDIKSKLTPMMTNKKDLETCYVMLKEIMEKMTVHERVEDLREIQFTILQSATGGCVPFPESSDSVSKMSPKSTSNLAETISGKTTKLIIEWISSNHGERLISALKALCLISATHDGIDDACYSVIHKAIYTSAGLVFVPILDALKKIGVLYPREANYLESKETDIDLQSITLDKEEEPSSRRWEENKSYTLTKTYPLNVIISLPKNRINQIAKSAVKLATKNIRRSKYNHLYHIFQLGNSSQADNVRSEPKSSSFPFNGEHTPIISRISENLFYHEINTTGRFLNQVDRENEIISINKLKEGLKYLNFNSKTISSLGRVQDNDSPGDDNRSKTNQTSPPPLLNENQMVVIIITGGCTMAEVSSLRLVASRRNWRLLILTTCVINSNDIIKHSAAYLSEALN